MPGIFGAVSLRGERRLDEPWLERLGACLCPHPRLLVRMRRSPDGRAAIGVVALSGSPASAVCAGLGDGGLAAVHGDVVVPVPDGDGASSWVAAIAADPERVRDLAGPFALALWDPRRQRLVLATDRFGLRNVYWMRVDDLVVFAPLVGALLAVSPGPVRVDEAAVADLLACEHVLGERTLVVGVQALAPASIARFEAGKTRIARYWLPRYVARERRRPEAALADELAALLARATVRALGDGRRAALAMSGGLDSRALLSVAVREVPGRLTCITYGVPRCDDVRFAAELAARAGAEHHCLPLPPGTIAARAAELVRLTDGMHLALNVHAATLQQAVEWCDVLVLGNGGDCLLDRLWWWPDEPADERTYVARMFSRLNLGLSPAMARELLQPRLCEAFDGVAERLRARLALYPGGTAADAADAFNVGERHWRWVLQGVPAQATHVEFREPFYDRDVAEFALGVPVDLRASRRAHRLLIRRHAPALARVPLPGGRGLATDPLVLAVQRRVRALGRRLSRLAHARPPVRQRLDGFADYDWELRHGSRALLEDVVVHPRTLERGWYRAEVLRALVDDHLGGRANHARLLGTIATVELWLREFVDGG